MTDEYVYWNGFRARPENLPQKRPGAYVFTNLANGKAYVGIAKSVASRCAGHARSVVSRTLKPRLPKFENALRKYGAGAFLVEPVVYSVGAVVSWGDDGAWLRCLETELITQLDSIREGYNIVERWMGGPYGEEFSRVAREAHNTPEYREKMRALLADPDYLARRNEAIRRAYQRPEVRANHLAAVRSDDHRKKISEATRAAMSDPDVRERFLASQRTTEMREMRRQALAERMSNPVRSAASITRMKATKALTRDKRSQTTRELMADPEVKERQRAGLAAAWADPEYRERRRAQNTSILRDPEVRARQVASLKKRLRERPMIWITNWVSEKRIEISSGIPDGWRRGRKKT